MKADVQHLWKVVDIQLLQARRSVNMVDGGDPAPPEVPEVLGIRTDLGSEVAQDFLYQQYGSGIQPSVN